MRIAHMVITGRDLGLEVLPVKELLIGEDMAD